MELIHHMMNAPIVVISLILLVILKLRPPKKMNVWYAYRTTSSMKSQEHWDLAQKLCADSGIFHMSVLLVIQIAAFLLTDGNTLTLNGLLILWVLSIVVIIAGVEKKLKQIE